MSKLYDLQELVEKTQLPERTVRYYLAKVLDAPGGTRGRKAFYSQETLNQLKLAKQVLMQDFDPKRGEVKPSLMDFQKWLKTLSDTEIREMVEMPYRIKPKTLLQASAPQATQKEASKSPRYYSDTDHSTSPKAFIEDGKKNTKDSAAQYLDRVMESTSTPAGRSQQWQSFRFGDDLEIRTRKQLTSGQQEQLRLAGKLLQSVLKER